MATHRGKAIWEGDLKQGQGRVMLPDSDVSLPYSAVGRFEGGEGTSPEALIGAAHAGCFSQALAKLLGDKGHPPSQLDTEAKVTIEKRDDGFAITSIRLRCSARVPDIAEDQFGKLAHAAKENCPVSQLVRGGTTIELEFDLAS
jgi:osmotically inducible protein OsmC